MFAQDNWVQLLLIAQLALNSRVLATMRYSQFFANYGYKPSIRLPLIVKNLSKEGLQQAKWLRQTHKEVCRRI